MTGEEMERAIEFLLKGQANHEARLGVLTDKVEELAGRVEELVENVNQLTVQVTETSKQLQTYAQTQSVFIETVTRSLEAQDQINASLRTSDARTDERLNKLIGLFEQHITTGH